jgi:hypothetical protein
MMIHTNSPAACEVAGDILLTFMDRGPSSHRNQVRGLAEFLKSLGSIRDGTGNRQAQSISLTVDVEDY